MIPRMSSGSSRADKRGRADEIAEHHRELAALGGVREASTDGRQLPTRDRLAAALFRPAIALRSRFRCPRGHAELFKIGVAQVRQNFGVNSVLAERSFILAKPEAPQPISHVHDSVSR